MGRVSAYPRSSAFIRGSNPQSSQGERKRLKNWRRRFRRDGNERQGKLRRLFVGIARQKGRVFAFAIKAERD
jgi:hypothetical protein